VMSTMSKKLYTTCNKKQSASAIFYCKIHIVVLIISVFWTVSLMVVVLNFSEQMGVQHLGTSNEINI